MSVFTPRVTDWRDEPNWQARLILRIRAVHAEAVAAYRAAPTPADGVAAAHEIITADRLTFAEQTASTLEARAEFASEQYAAVIGDIGPSVALMRARGVETLARRAAATREFADRIELHPPCADCLAMGATRLFAGKVQCGDGLCRCKIHARIYAEDPGADLVACTGPCALTLPREAFNADSRRRNGLQSACRDCRKAAAETARTMAMAGPEAAGEPAEVADLIDRLTVHQRGGWHFAKILEPLPLATLRWLAYRETTMPEPFKGSRAKVLAWLTGTEVGPSPIRSYGPARRYRP